MKHQRKSAAFDRNPGKIDPLSAYRSISKIAVPGLTALWLRACTPGSPNVYRGSNQERVIGNGPSVSITNVASEDEAFPFAEQYCKARNKAAKFIRIEMLSRRSIASRSAVFDCV